LDKQVGKFTSEQIVTHVIIGISIMLLFITGLPQRYPEHLGWMISTIGLSKVMFIHRLAAIGMLSSAVFYVINSMLCWIFVGNKYFKKYMLPIFPTSGDVSDFVNDVSVWGEQKTDYYKYSWLEKLSLWNDMVVNWAILGVTGIVLWAPWLFAPYIPVGYLSVAKSFHSGFAVFSLCVVLLHFYIVHLTPSKFPMAYSMFTGTVSKEEVKEEYPRWYRELSGEKHG